MFRNRERYDPSIKIENEEEDAINLEKLKGLSKEVAENLRNENIPVDDECRIDINAFGDVYSAEVLKKDKELIERQEKDWYGSSSEKENKERKTGDQLEVLKTVIFHKFLKSDFITARASNYDDYNNKVDNIILERKTGNLVCALDEVSLTSGQRFEEKSEKILNRNKKENGSRLKYGLKLEENKLKLGQADTLPIFYLALSKKYLKEGLNKMSPSLEETSSYEKKLFEYFIASLDSQIKRLKLEPDLNPELKDHIKAFETAIEKFEDKNDNS